VRYDRRLFKNCFQQRLIFYGTPVFHHYFVKIFYAVTKGNNLSAVFLFLRFKSRLSWVKDDLWQGLFYIILRITACYEALFKCCFWRVCSKQSYCFVVGKASFYPWRVARSEMGIWACWKSAKFTLLWFTMWFADCVSLKGCLFTYLFLRALGCENALRFFSLAVKLTFVEAS